MDFEENIRQLRGILSANIKKQRKILGLTQERLAEAADLSSNMVNDIEGGKTWVSDKTIIKLAKALGLNAYELILPAQDAAREDRLVSNEVVLRLKRSIDTEFECVLNPPACPPGK
jgi:transcriptional regulator with XRE-family HTH domain